MRIIEFFIKMSLILLGCMFLFACTDMVQNLHNLNQSQQTRLLQQYGLAKSAQQTVIFKFPNTVKPWKIVDQITSNSGSSVTYVPSNENFYNWNESIRMIVIPYHSFSGIDARKLVQLEAEDARNSCQGVDAKIIFQSSAYLIYTLDVVGCTGNESQWQMGKAFNGIDAVYAIRYSAVAGKVSQSEFNLVTNVIKTTKLVRNE